MKEKFKNLCVVLVVLYVIYTVASFIFCLALASTDTQVGKKYKDFLTKVWERIKYEFRKVIDLFSNEDPVVE